MIYGTPEFDEVMLDILKKDYRHPSYEASVKHAEEMSWHFFGDKPEGLLKRTRPNEDPEITAYRLENYEPTTKSAADKAIKITSKILNPNLFSIRWEKQSTQSEELRKYTLEDYPVTNSLPNFMKDVTLRKMLADPNAVIVATLAKVPESQTDVPKPILKIFGSKNVFNYDEDHFLLNVSIQDNIFTFDYYDLNRFISFEVYAKNKKLYYTEIEDYPYEFGEIPAWFLGGMSEAMDDGTVTMKSFYSSAAPYWNLAITHESDTFAAYIRHMFPQKYEIAEVCNYKYDYEGQPYPCRAGQIRIPGKGKEYSHIECPHCSGSGFNPITPHGVYKYTKDKLSGESGSMGIDPVGYITVPVDATKMLEERAQKMCDKGLWAINMEVEDKVGENQSGVAKVIDRSAQYDTLYDIGTVMFDTHITNAYYFFNLYMFGVSTRAAGKSSEAVYENLPQVNKPTYFDVASTQELINNFKAAKESGLDPNFLQIKQMEIQTRDLSTNPDLKKFTTLLLDLDPLPGMATMDVNTNVSRGFVAKTDAVIHFNIKAFVERAIRENPDFASEDKETQLEVLNVYAQEFVKANKPVIDQTAIPGLA